MHHIYDYVWALKGNTFTEHLATNMAIQKGKDIKSWMSHTSGIVCKLLCFYMYLYSQ